MPTDARAEFTGDDEENFERVQAFLKENNARKQGKSETLRVGMRLAADRLDDMDEEKAEIGELIESYESKKEKYLP